MADQDLATLVVRLEASTKEWQRQLARAQGTTVAQLRKLDKEAEAAGKRFDAAFARGLGGLKTAAGMLAGFVGFGAIAGELKRLADIDDASQKIGITAEALQSLQYAAMTSGSSAEEMTRALIYFNKEAGESGDKASKLAALFNANGVAMRDAGGNLLPVSDLLTSYARLVAGAANEQEAAAIAAIGFGKAGSGMVPVLKQMAEGMAGIEGAARDAGVVVAGDLVKKAGEFDDAWNTAILSVKAGLANLAGDIASKLPAIARSSWADRAADAPASQRNVLDTVPGIQKMTEAQQSAVFRAVDDLAARLERGQTRIDVGAAYGTIYKPPAPPATRLPPSGGADKAKTENDYQREVASVQKKIAALEAEAAAVGKSAVEIEKAKIKQELLNAANEAGVNKQGQLNGQIDALATKAAEAQVKLDELRAAQERTKQATESFITTTSDLAGTFAVDFKNGLAEGMTAAESFRAAMGNMVNAVADMLLRLAAQMMVIMALQAAGVPIPANMMPVLPFGGGRAGGGDVVPGRRYRIGEQGPEDVVFGRAGTVIPNHAIERRGGDQIVFSPSMSINAPGADTAALKGYVDAGFAKMRQELPGIVKQHRWSGRMQ